MLRELVESLRRDHAELIAEHDQRLTRLEIASNDGPETSSRYDGPAKGRRTLWETSTRIDELSVATPIVSAVDIVASDTIIAKVVNTTGDVYIGGNLHVDGVFLYRGFPLNPRTPTLAPSSRPTPAPTVHATSCQEIKNQNPSASSGLFDINIDVGAGPNVVQVYCEMATDGGGWTLIGRTIVAGLTTTEKNTIRNGNWNAYTNTGYGSPNPDSRIYWMPLKYWAVLTSSTGDLWQQTNLGSQVRVTGYTVSDAAGFYRQDWTGTATGYLAYQPYNNHMNFTTLDADHDTAATYNCAFQNHGYAGGWWYNNCYQLSMLHPNGNAYRFDANAVTAVSYMNLFFR